jgi:hypothetical protein
VATNQPRFVCLDCLVGLTNQIKNSSTGWQPNLYSRGLFGWSVGGMVMAVSVVTQSKSTKIPKNNFIYNTTNTLANDSVLRQIILLY